MNVIVRPAVIEDADLIVYFVKQLAIFEKHDPSLVRLTPEKSEPMDFPLIRSSVC